MYTRPPSREEPKIKIPENYGGSMFKSGPGFYPTYPQGKNLSSERMSPDKNTMRSDRPENPRVNTNKADYPHPAPAEDEVSSFEEASENIPDDMTVEETAEVSGNEPDPPDEISQPVVSALPTPDNKCERCERKGSLFSSILPPGALKNNFPFGHGIGSEELLIMGIMRMVYLSGNNDKDPDGELILLLAMLLFAG